MMTINLNYSFISLAKVNTTFLLSWTLRRLVKNLFIRFIITLFTSVCRIEYTPGTKTETNNRNTIKMKVNTKNLV